jgi:hypothetical protein
MRDRVFKILIEKYHDGTGDHFMGQMAREWSKDKFRQSHLAALDNIGSDAVGYEEIGIFNHYRHISLEAWQ